MNARWRAGVALAFCICVVGCAGSGAPSLATATAMLAGTKPVSARDIKDAVTLGKSSKADLIAALGKTTVISFDSGFEVWVYRYAGDGVTGGAAAKSGPVERIEHSGWKKGTSAKAEFVVLFAPSGVVTKTRIRPAPPPSAL